MEPGLKDEKNGTPKKALVEDEDEYPGILPCQGRKEGLYPWVSLTNVQDGSAFQDCIIHRWTFLFGFAAAWRNSQCQCKDW